MELLHHSLSLVIQIRTFISDLIHFLYAYKMFLHMTMNSKCLHIYSMLIVHSMNSGGKLKQARRLKTFFFQMLEKMYKSANKHLSRIILASEM